MHSNMNLKTNQKSLSLTQMMMEVLLVDQMGTSAHQKPAGIIQKFCKGI